MTLAAHTQPRLTQRSTSLQAVFDDWLASRPGKGPRAGNGTLSATSAQLYRDMWAVFAQFLLSRPKKRGADPTGLTALHKHDLEAFVAEGPTLCGRTEPWSDRYTWRMLHLIDRVLRFQRLRTEPEAQRRGETVSAAAQVLHDTPVRWANASHLDGEPEPLSAAQARRVRRHLETAAPGRTDQPWKTVRDHAMVAVMLGAGLAPGDVQALPLSAIQGCPAANEAGLDATVWLEVPADGLSPAHVAPLASWAVPVLTQWLQRRETCGIAGTMAFPSTAKGSVLSRMSCHRRVVAVLDLAGVTGGVPFRLRHTCAVGWLRAGHPEDQVAQWLGLVEQKALRRYLGVAKRVSASRG